MFATQAPEPGTVTMSRNEPLLKLDDQFTHLVKAGDALILVGDDSSLFLEGSVPGDIVRLIDGRRSAVDIAAELGPAHRPEVVHFVILTLTRSGHVAAVNPGEAEEVAGGGSDVSECWRPGISAVADRLEEAWSNRDGANVVRLGLTRREGHSMTLLLTDDYLHSELLDDPDVSVGDEPILLACLGSRRVWIGPWIHSQVAACIACLQDRLRLNLPARTLVHAENPPGAFVVERLPRKLPRTAFEHLADAVAEIDVPAAFRPASQQLKVIPLDGLAPHAHPVMRLPHCTACGDPALGPPGAAIELQSRPRGASSVGGYRVVDPLRTLERFSPLVSPVTGVVRRIRRLEVQGTDIVNVYTASHAHHYGTASVRAIKDEHRDHGGGKGRTDVDARVSALCESLERFSSVHRGDERTRIARLSELGQAAIHPNALMHFSEAQYATRQAWNEGQQGSFQSVPDPYDDEAIAWSRVRSLASGEIRLVPSAFLFFDFQGEGSRFCEGDSNGLAGGNCLEEAILHGFLELVERDAVALWWYNRARRPDVDLTSLRDPWAEQLLAFYASLRRTVWALDITTDLGIPAFVALSAKRPASSRGTDSEDIIFGFGAHLDARIALTRALTELNQMLPTVQQGYEERRRRLLPDFGDAIEWWETATLERHDYLRPARGSSARSIGDYATPLTADLREDILYCVTRAASVDCDVLVHDLTRADVGLAVAKVIVPGLRHFWKRLGPGRLYDAPVKMGWVERPTREPDMNPIPMFV